MQNGKVVARAVIQRDGSVTDLSITQNLSPLNDAEALRLLKQMPKWKPAINGRPQNDTVAIPIEFKIPQTHE